MRRRIKVLSSLSRGRSFEKDVGVQVFNNWDRKYQFFRLLMKSCTTPSIGIHDCRLDMEYRIDRFKEEKILNENKYPM